eukprot:4410229-Prymnesium_polylepis.1
MRMARAIGAPLTKNSSDHRRALQPAFERCATPLTMGTAIFVTLSTRVRGGVYHLAHLPGSPALLR